MNAVQCRATRGSPWESATTAGATGRRKDFAGPKKDGRTAATHNNAAAVVVIWCKAANYFHQLTS